jgi:hypothetical protein
MSGNCRHSAGVGKRDAGQITVARSRQAREAACPAPALNQSFSDSSGVIRAPRFDSSGSYWIERVCDNQKRASMQQPGEVHVSGAFGSLVRARYHRMLPNMKNLKHQSLTLDQFEIREIVQAIKERIDFGGRGDDGQRSVNCDAIRLA